MSAERVQIDANSFVFSARVAGPAAGRPVILLHGFPETSYSWLHQLGGLADAGFRALAPDQRGYSPGARPTGVESYAMDHLVADVIALADTMEMPRFDLVGHDWGGMVAWVVGARHGDRVRSLTVASTPHPLALRSALSGGDADQSERSRYIEVFRQPEVPERILLGEDGSGAGLRRLYETSGLQGPAVEEYIGALRAPGAMTAALNWYRAMSGEGMDALPPVVVPTLYVWSTGDVALGRGAAEATAHYVAGRYRFEVLDGVSHWIPEEAADVFTGLLLEHLADT